MTKKITIGIMPQEQIRARMVAIAQGEYQPKASDPKIWFTSMKALDEALNDENRHGLPVARTTEFQIITA